MGNSIGIVGAPTSAGAFAAGQEKAPLALREAGLVDWLSAAGLDVVDYGDVAGWRWRPDRENPRVQNLAHVVEAARAVAQRVSEVRAVGRRAIVLGGDCTVELGTVSGHLVNHEKIGLIYFDMHADLNVPDGPPPGALDWMGVAHMLGIPGSIAQLSHIGPQYPMLQPQQVLLFAHRGDQATPWELEAIKRHSLATIPLEDVAEKPEVAATQALNLIEKHCDTILVHFDVDVIDFTDAPLSENTGLNIGLQQETALRSLTVLLEDSRVSALTVTELNPEHGEPDGITVKAFAGGLASALTASHRPATAQQGAL
jgi:arginase